MKRSLIVLSLIAAGFTSVPANADLQQGDFLVRAGAVLVSPDESNSGIKAGGTDLGGDVSVDNNTQLGLNFAYMVAIIGLLSCWLQRHLAMMSN